MGKYFYRVLISVSMLVNVLMFGEIGQTLSARHYDRKRNGKWNLSRQIDWLLGENHCLECWCWWKTRKW